MRYQRRYKKKKPNKKRPYNSYGSTANKRNIASGRITSVRSLPIGLPDKFTMKLNYNFTETVTTGTITDTVFRLNSLFDPYFTGVGSQPMYFDQMAVLYSRYKVFGVEYTIRAINNSGSESVKYVILVGGSSATITNLNDTIESTYSHNRILATGDSKLFIRGYVSLKKIAGQKLIDKDWGATVGTNPASSLYMHIAKANVDLFTAISTYYEVKLTFFCQFTDRQNIGGS